MNSSYLTIHQASEYLGVSDSTLRRWHANARLVPAKVDRVTRYRYYTQDQLNAFWSTAWQTNGRTPIRQQSLFTSVDLFSGIGGIRLAFEELGGTCVYSSEIDRFACQTYAKNFGEWPDGDITQIEAEEIPPHDILLAGFPCQPFSLAGVPKYGSLGRDHGFLDQTKGTLFFDIVRILQHHRPRAFLLENVKNLRSHDKRRTWKVISGALDELGYQWDARVLDARTIVPQHRERIFIVGFRDPVTFEWPMIQDRKPKLQEILEPEVDERYTLSDHLWNYLKQYAARHRAKGNGFGYGLADLDGVSRTLSARYHKDGAEILIPQQGKNPRRLTPRECARLMGFPETFQIPVSDTQAYRQFGNAVVVPLVRIIASAMLEALNHPTVQHQPRPRQIEISLS